MVFLKNRPRPGGSSRMKSPLIVVCGVLGTCSLFAFAHRGIKEDPCVTWAVVQMPPLTSGCRLQGMMSHPPIRGGRIINLCSPGVENTPRQHRHSFTPKTNRSIANTHPPRLTDVESKTTLKQHFWNIQRKSWNHFKWSWLFSLIRFKMEWIRAGLEPGVLNPHAVS